MSESNQELEAFKTLDPYLIKTEPVEDKVLFEVKFDLPWRDAENIAITLGPFPTFGNIIVERICDSCGKIGIQNEVVYSCETCEGQYDECKQCHEQSNHQHQDNFYIETPDRVRVKCENTNRVELEYYDLVIYSPFTPTLDGSMKKEEHLRYRPDFSLTKKFQFNETPLPNSGLKPYEWRNWVKRTGGASYLYDDILVLPEYCEKIKP